MSAKDATHKIVRHALEKDGWIITHDPYYIEVGGVELYIDLGADAIVAAERAGQKIAVYDEFFTLQFIQKAVQRADLKLLIYNELQEVISQWIP